MLTLSNGKGTKLLVKILDIMIIFALLVCVRNGLGSYLQYHIIETAKTNGQNYITKRYGDHFQLISYQEVSKPSTIFLNSKSLAYIELVFEDMNKPGSGIMVRVDGDYIVYDSYQNRWYAIDDQPKF